jgi:hypothetical protein
MFSEAGFRDYFSIADDPEIIGRRLQTADANPGCRPLWTSQHFSYGLFLISVIQPG